MSDHVAVLDGQIWNAWLQKTKIHDLRTAYKMKISAAVMLGLVAVGATSYVLGLIKLYK